MDSSPPLFLSSTSTQQEPAAEEAAELVGSNRRSAGRRMGRERLLRYVHDVIRKQRTPLHEIVRDHALPFLPAQSLLRFRAVSAPWSRHISSPFFAHTQSLSHRSPSGLFPTSQPYPPSSYLPFDPASGAVPDPSFGFLPEGAAVRVWASARGLVCCSGVSKPHRRAHYYVCNPATAQWTAVPYSSIFHHSAVAFLFQPSPLNFSADFYLVCVVQNNRRTGFEVFSSRTGSWRLSNEVVSGGGLLCSDLAVSAGGAAHWGTASGAVLSYDPAADRCRVTQLPEDMAAEDSPWRLAEVDGMLCCCRVRRPSTQSTVAVDVYVLGEGCTWRKMRSLEVEGEEVWPLISEGGDHEVLLCVDGSVVGFSLASGRGRLLRGPPIDVGNGQCLPYVSSLVPLKKVR